MGAGLTPSLYSQAALMPSRDQGLWDKKKITNCCTHGFFCFGDVVCCVEGLGWFGLVWWFLVWFWSQVF
jgi:hypothetical protein